MPALRDLDTPKPTPLATQLSRVRSFMKTPIAATEWLQEKCDLRWSTVREARTVTREWVRFTGGRIMRAELSGSIEPSAEFELVVTAPGIEAEYVSGAKNGALTVLVSQNWAPVFAVKLHLQNFKPHPIESSYAAFYNVAHEVISHLLGVAPGSQHNIKW